MRDPKLYLKDISEAMEAIERFVEGIDFETFEDDDMRMSAVIQKFEIIGEASKSVPESIKQKYTSVPWNDMAGMRDRLIHFYFGIKYDLVWNTIKQDIPEVKPLIREILEDIECVE
jgi:uncharacterized protein with HEPN domain